MFIKPCPFCGQFIEELYKDGEWILSCPSCKERGLSIELINGDKKEAEQIWNNRTFDNLLLKDPEAMLELLKFFAGKDIDPNKDVSFLKFSTTYIPNYFNDREMFGWLIFPNGKAVQCENTHKEALIKYLHMDINEIENMEQYLERYIDRKGFARISSYKNSFGIDLPQEVKSKQIDAIIDVLLSNCKKEDRFVMEYYSNKWEVKRFENINELIKLLTLLKKGGPYDVK